MGKIPNLQFYNALKCKYDVDVKIIRYRHRDMFHDRLLAF